MAKQTITPRQARTFLNSLTQEQQESLDTLKELLTKKDTDLLRFHDIGQCIRILHPRTAQTSLYRKKRIPVLQKALQMSNLPVSLSLLYRSLKLVKTYDRQEIKQLRRTLTWEEVITLLHVKKDDRKRLQEEAVDEKWPSRELRQQIAEVKDRGHRLSLRQLRKLASRWQEVFERFWEGKEAKRRAGLRRWALNRPSEDRLKGLQEATDLFEALHKAAGDLAGALKVVTGEMAREL